MADSRKRADSSRPSGKSASKRKPFNLTFLVIALVLIYIAAQFFSFFNKDTTNYIVAKQGETVRRNWSSRLREASSSIITRAAKSLKRGPWSPPSWTIITGISCRIRSTRSTTRSRISMTANIPTLSRPWTRRSSRPYHPISAIRQSIITVICML